MKKIYKTFTKGLYLSGPIDDMPVGTVRRNRGIGAIAENSFLSRPGSTQLYALDAHSIVYFADAWFSGVGTSIYRASTEKVTGLGSSNRLSFAAMPPSPGKPDYLFIVGSGTAFKVDSDGTGTLWGIAPPLSDPTLADSGVSGDLGTGTYKYLLTYKNSVTGSRSNPSGSFEFTPTQVTVTTSGQAAENWSDTIRILLHLDNAVTDSMSRHTVTNNNVTFSATKKFGTHSAVFDGSTSELVLPASEDWVVGDTLDFFCHFWINPDDVVGTQSLFSYYADANNYMQLYLNTSTLTLIYQKGGSQYFAITKSGVAVTTWQHIGFGRKDGIFFISLDGVITKGTHRVGIPNFSPSDGSCHIGSFDGSTGWYDGYMDEFLFVKGATIWSLEEDFTPPANPTAAGFDIANGSGNKIDLSEIPESSDSQVDTVEIWRTVSDGNIFFLATTVPNGTTSFRDNIPDTDLLNETIKYTNAVPYGFFDDCYGPYNNSMFMITRTQEGHRGRVYYSRIGYPEAMEGYINVTSDDDVLQRLFSWAGNLYVLSESKLFQIYGTNPYYSKEIAGAVGTSKPHTVAVTPVGPIWEGSEGWHTLVGGSQSKLIDPSAIMPVVRGVSAGNLTDFDGVVADFARNEYIVSDGSQTLAYDVTRRTWRDLGVGLTAIHYSQSADKIGATLSSKIVDFEKEGDTQDNGTNITIDLETPHEDFGQAVSVETVRVDANSTTETLAVTLYHDGESLSLGNLSTTTGRRHSEFAVDGHVVNRVGVRVNGTVDAQVEVYGIEVEYHPLNLLLRLGGETLSLPGRLSGDRQAITFELMDESAQTDNIEYIFERLFLDLDSSSANIAQTLNLFQNTSISLGNASSASRQMVETSLYRMGKFQSLVLTGDFSATTVSLRQVELIAVPLVLLIYLDEKVIEIPGTFNAAKSSLVFEVFRNREEALNHEYIFEHFFYDMNTSDVTITCTLDLIGNTSIALGTVDVTTRTQGEVAIGKTGRFTKLTLAGTFTSAIYLYRLELRAHRTNNE